MKQIRYVAAVAVGVVQVLFVGCLQPVDSRPQDTVEDTAEAKSDVVAPACNMPNESPVTSCSAACPGQRCGGRLWASRVIPYQIDSAFSSTEAATIDSAVSTWNSIIGGGVSWSHCAGNVCVGQPRITQFTSCPGCGVNSTHENGAGTIVSIDLAPNPTERSVAHEMGHALNLPHTFQRFDRDRYVRTGTTYMCAGHENLLWKCKMGDATDAANPQVPTGLLGLYDSLSVMNYRSNDICENDGQEPADTDGPSENDGSAVQELYRTLDGWAPFQNLGKDVGADSPLSQNLISTTPAVYMVGSPAVSSWGAPLLDIFVRGSDGHIYYKWKNVSGGVFQSWSSWTDMGGGFISDPAAVSWASGRTDLVAQKSDGYIYIKTFSGGVWSGWSSLNAPSVGAGSAPVIASWGANRLDVFVRGASDNSLWQLTYQSGWTTPWTQRGGTFHGKPAAVAWGTNRIDVVVHGGDDAAWINWFDGTWHSFYSLGGTLYHTGGASPTYSSPALASNGVNSLQLFLRGMDSRLWQKAWTGSAWTGYIPLGGIMTDDPAAVGKSGGRIDIIAPNTDHGNKGVWWKYAPFNAGCLVEDPSVCGACGCGGYGQLPCTG